MIERLFIELSLITHAIYRRDPPISNADLAVVHEVVLVGHLNAYVAGIFVLIDIKIIGSRLRSHRPPDLATLIS